MVFVDMYILRVWKKSHPCYCHGLFANEKDNDVIGIKIPINYKIKIDILQRVLWLNILEL